nr:MAG TPA: hypothetical protein [Microviridae sp.]
MSAVYAGVTMACLAAGFVFIIFSIDIIKNWFK